MVGIIVAIDEELDSLKKYIKEKKEELKYNLQFFKGYINDKEVVIVKSGVGKVNAARATQILIDSYNPEFVINVGVAGGVDKSLEIGDIVCATKLVQHDFDITPFGHEKGYITDVGTYFETDKKLVNKINELVDCKLGVIATGDIFCTEDQMGEKINNKFNALCVEMEGAAIAQVCYLCNKSFIVLRSISDVINNNNHVDYNEFVKESSNRIASLLNKFIKII